MLRIKQLDKETIEISDTKLSKIKLRDSIIVQVPNDMSGYDKEKLYNELVKVFDEDSLIVVDDTVKFCKLEGK